MWEFSSIVFVWKEWSNFFFQGIFKYLKLHLCTNIFLSVMEKGDMINNVQELLNSTVILFKSTRMAVGDSSCKVQTHWFQTLQLELPCLDFGVLAILIYFCMSQKFWITFLLSWLQKTKLHKHFWRVRCQEKEER